MLTIESQKRQDAVVEEMRTKGQEERDERSVNRRGTETLTNLWPTSKRGGGTSLLTPKGVRALSGRQPGQQQDAVKDIGVYRIQIYQKHENSIDEVWNPETRQIYVESFE